MKLFIPKPIRPKRQITFVLPLYKEQKNVWHWATWLTG